MTLMNTPDSASATASSACSCGAFRVEQARKSADTFPIPHARDRGGAAALARLLGELDQALLILAIGDERVLGLLERPQHDLLEGGDRLARRAFGAAQPCPRAAEIEGRPAQAGVTAQARDVGHAEQVAAAGEQAEEAADA